MTYTVFLSLQAEKFYKKLNKNLKDKVREVLIALQNQPRIGKDLHGDLKGNYSIRIGRTQIMRARITVKLVALSPPDDSVLLLRLGHYFLFFVIKVFFAPRGFHFI